MLIQSFHKHIHFHEFLCKSSAYVPYIHFIYIDHMFCYICNAAKLCYAK